MDLTSYVDDLRSELVAAAEAGGDESRALAERLVGPLESATRLALLEALSAAADEITRELAPGAVEVRLRGRDPEFVVMAPPPEESSGETSGAGDVGAGFPPPPSSVSLDEDEGGTSRITLRLPTHLKPRIDESASRAGLSANAWLVRVIAAALQPDERQGDRDRARVADRRTGTPFGRRHTGWVR
jgi:hypothetical protein